MKHKLIFLFICSSCPSSLMVHRKVTSLNFSKGSTFLVPSFSSQKLTRPNIFIPLSQLGSRKQSFLSSPTSTNIQNSTIFQSNEIQHKVKTVLNDSIITYSEHFTSLVSLKILLGGGIGRRGGRENFGWDVKKISKKNILRHFKRFLKSS